MSKNYTKLLYWLPPFFWALLIFFLSSYPTGVASEIKWQDFALKKLAHIVEYAVFTVLAYRAFLNSGVPRQKAVLYSVFLSIVYGMTDEIHQSFTPGREPRVRDVFFDTIGASIAGYLLWKLLPLAPMRLKKLAKSLQLS